MIIKTSYPFMKPPPSARLIRGHRLAQGLVFFPLFNEGGGLQVFDLSENGNTGIIYNGSWIVRKFGSVLSFNGDSTYIDVPDMDSYLTGPFTISFWWFNKNNTGTFIAFSSNLTGTTGKLASINGKFFIRVIEDGASDYTIALPSQDAWHHIVLRRDSSNKVDLIIDGGIANRLFGDAAQVGTSNIFRIIGVSVATQYFFGYLDVFSIYNRDLSTSEIAEVTYRPFCMLERRARTALMSGYEVVVPPEGIVVLRRRRESA